jgi:hypothetical protein
VSLILTGLIVAGTSGIVVLGRWIAKRRKSAADEPDPNAKKDAPGEDKETPAKGDHLVGFPCQLGDVLMRVTGEEAWLAGGVVLSEEMPVAALFVAPDAGQDCAIYVCPHPRESVAWLAPLDPDAILVGGEPPSAVEHEGIRFERVRRLPLRPRRIGVGAPEVGDAVLVAEYASTGSDRLLLVKGSSGATRAYRGHELEPHAFEVIASGRATLE